MTMLHADSEKLYEEDKKMAEENNNFKTTLESLFKGMDGVVSSKTVVGDAIHIGGTIILPLVDVSFGIGAGAFSGDKKEKGMGGIGGKMTPSAVIVIQDGKTRLVNIKNQDTITKILDMVPDVIDRFTAYYKNLEQKPFLEDYRRRMFLTGQKVTVVSGGSAYPAVAGTVDDEFALTVTDANGQTHRLQSGEVTIALE